jgi:hypothetical protein
MSGIFGNIDSPLRGGGGSIVRKSPDTALYSINVSTLRATGT